MQGRILDVDIAQGKGLILGNDGNRYTFTSAEWRTGETPSTGMTVDFVAADTEAREIFPLPGQAGGPWQTAAPAGAVPPGPQPVYVARAPASNDNSVVLGWIGVACLVLGFIIPVLPTIAAFILGLIGADSGKRNHNSTGIVLSRIAWIGALTLMVLGILLIAFGLQLLTAVTGVTLNEIMNGNWNSID